MIKYLLVKNSMLLSYMNRRCICRIILTFYIFNSYNVLKNKELKKKRSSLLSHASIIIYEKNQVFLIHICIQMFSEQLYFTFIQNNQTHLCIKVLAFTVTTVLKHIVKVREIFSSHSITFGLPRSCRFPLVHRFIGNLPVLLASEFRPMGCSGSCWFYLDRSARQPETHCPVKRLVYSRKNPISNIGVLRDVYNFVHTITYWLYLT